MTLKELILAVKDHSLPKEKLEAYRDDISNLFAQLHFEMADVKKEKALYFIDNKYNEPLKVEYDSKSPDISKVLLPTERSDKSIERMWQATPKGLREIELNHYAKATEEILRSLKSRLYNLY